MNFFWYTLGVGGVILQLVVIYFMTKGFHRRFPWVFLYLLVLFLTGISDFAGALDPDAWVTWYRGVYYTNNAVRQIAGFFAVASLYIYATREHPRRAAIRLRALGAAFGLLAVTVGIAYATTEGGTFFLNQVFRNASFLTALLNVALWFGLIKWRVSDKLLLMVSGGLGLNMTGEAIAQALLGMSEADAVQNVANFIGVSSHLLCLYVWILALRYSIRNSRTAVGDSPPVRQNQSDS